ncbi:MAG: TonB-dependent receptor [Maricaulaceae bacterium]
MLRFRNAAAAVAAAALPLCPAAAQDEAAAQGGAATDNDTIIIFGRAVDLTGEAQSASEGVVGYGDFSLRPMLRPGELVEVIPGMIATQHSGGGKANQYFLRGFNLDHGTDFAGSIDGVPLNLRSHPHMNGYLDINFIIPEVIETVEFAKGTHHVALSDFSVAGAATFNTYDSVDQGFIGADVDSDGFYRLIAVDSYELGGDATLLYAANAEFNEGPFDVSEDLEKYSGMLKYSFPFRDGRLTASLIGYDSEWYATDQIPLRAVESGMISRFGSLDPNLGGKTHRYIASLRGEWDRASLTGYVQNYALDLYGNPTFFIDQVNGDEFVQVGRRWSYGANGEIERDLGLHDGNSWVRLGFDTHFDDIDQTGLFLTTDRAPRETIRDDAVEAWKSGAFAEVGVDWTDRFRTSVGLRADHYAFDVSAVRPENSGDGSDTIFSPKASAVFATSDALEFYANYGQGFHTNDARGVVITVDPATGDPADPVDLLVRGEGAELGLRYHPSGDFNFSLAAFALELDSESIFVGDAGTSEPSGGTERSGIEAAAFWQPNPWLALDASAAWSHARFADEPSGADRIPNSVELVAGAGATVLFDNGVTGSLRVRYLGESPLIEANSVRSDPTTLTNLGVEKNFGSFSLGLDVLNVFDVEDNDITYFYESQLLGEAAPVEDIHFHPVHPRSFKLVMRADF